MTALPAVVLFPAWFFTILLAGTIGAWCAWPVAFDRGFEEADGQQRRRHRHRIGDPQETTLLELPREGRLEPLTPMPPTHSEWTFFGAGVEVEPRPGPAEYELLTAPTVTMAATTATAVMTLPGDGRPDETPSAWTRRQALEMDAFIKAMREESNYFQHTILAERP